MSAGSAPGDPLGYGRRGRARREARRARRRRLALAALGAVLLAAVFLLGLALGRVLEEEPRVGGTQTRIRTLEPGTLPPVTRTVTVTTSAP